MHAGHRDAGGLRWGVEPICRVLTEHGLPIAPSTYYELVNKPATARDWADAVLVNEIRRVHAENESAFPDGPPPLVAGWRAAAEALLSPPCCTFHRNMEISSRYAWLYTQQPTCFKWAGMAAIASHHARLVLFPFRLDADGKAMWICRAA